MSIGLCKLSTGPRAGRYVLNFRRLDAAGRLLTAQKLYPKDWPAARIKRDAAAIVDAVLSGSYRRSAKVAAVAPIVTIASLVERVIAVFEGGDRSPATKAEFTSHVRGHIARLLGTSSVGALTTARLAAFVDSLRDEAKLSPSTVKNVVKSLATFCKIVRVRFDPTLTVNPVRDAFDVGLELPSKRREAPIFLSLADAGKLLACASEPRATRYALAMLTGLRDGEISGLTWEAIDLVEGLIHVRQALAAIGGIGPTKTLASDRSVPIHPDLAWRLRLLSAGGTAIGPVFPGRDGLACRPDSARLLRADLAAAGLPTAGITFHALRRSFATWLVASSVDCETIERLMGHEPRSVLGRHYAATSQEVLRLAVATLAIPGARPLRAVAS